MRDALRELDERGFRMCRGVVSAEVAHDLARAIEAAPRDDGSGRGRTSVAGRRNLLQVPAVRHLATSRAIRDLVEPILGPEAFAVRGILFDKTAEANWRLRWHQDKAIPVKERHEVSGFSGWSVKAGVVHAYPRSSVLENMLTVRLHLDSCGATEGALEVLPGSHGVGLLDQAALARRVAAGEPVVCIAEPGDALVMRPLLVHSSGKREQPGHRRIVHIEFAGAPLRSPLEWHEHVGLSTGQASGVSY